MNQHSDSGGAEQPSPAELPEDRRPRRLTLALGLVAGFVDAVGFLTLFSLFVANQSGNMTKLGVAIGHGRWAAALTLLTPVVVFGCGITAGAMTLQVLHSRRVRAPLAQVLGLETVFVVAFIVYATLGMDSATLRPNTGPFFVLAGLLGIAMGLQTAALRRVGGLTIHTTYITGMLTNAAVMGTALALDRLRLRDPYAARPNRRDFSLSGGLVVVYLAGASLGSFLLARVGIEVLAIPAAALALLAAWDAWRPMEIAPGYGYGPRRSGPRTPA